MLIQGYSESNSYWEIERQSNLGRPTVTVGTTRFFMSISINQRSKKYPHKHKSIIDSFERLLIIQSIPNSNISLKKPLIVKVKDEEGFVFMSMEDLDIHVGGSSIEEGKVEFLDFFINDYKNLIASKEDELDNSAKKLIKKYHEYINC